MGHLQHKSQVAFDTRFTLICCIFETLDIKSLVRMAPIALRLLELNTSIPAFLSALRASNVKPLTINRVIRWVIIPTSTSLQSVLTTTWDLLLVLPDTTPLPADLSKHIKTQWHVYAGMPSSLLKNFDARNQRLLNPQSGDVPPLSSHKVLGTKKSAQSLELNDELAAWIESYSKGLGSGAISMFNLLSFKPGKKASYLNYGKAFATDVGKKRGGVAKIVGKVIEVSSSPKVGGERGDNGKEFDEIAVAHYPSILHFADMLRGEDYQEANHKYRVPALRDTFILCTSELGLDGEKGPKL